MELHYVFARYEDDFDALARRLHVTDDCVDEFRDIYEECLEIAAPKGVFSVCAVERAGKFTVVGGHQFDSRVLAVNFEEQKRVYPYVISCGRELYERACAEEDPLYRFWIDGISEAALRAVGLKTREAVQETYGLGALNSVNPGSLADFPLPCQRPLFDLLGEGPDKIGLELTPTFLMLPYKSGSGIYFESEKHYENCSLCPRLTCPNRRAPYSEAMAAAYGLQSLSSNAAQAACES